MNLEGKVALITGASRGVGVGIAEVLAKAGCDLALAARATRDQPRKAPGTLEDTAELVHTHGRRALVVPTDLSQPEQVVRMIEMTVAEYGGLDVLINNAALNFVGDLDMTLKRYEAIMAVNLTGPMIAMREAMPHMARRGGGSIVNLSSLAAITPIPGLLQYGMAKIALERLTMQIAGIGAPHNIAANVFRIDVPCASEGLIAGAQVPEIVQRAEPVDVPAEAVLWILRQPPAFTANLMSLRGMQNDGFVPSRSELPYTDEPTQDFTGGFGMIGDSKWRQPYESAASAKRVSP